MQRAVIKANIVVFVASFCTLVIELVAGRILAPYLGVSLYTWTSIIGVVLAGISVGAYLGGLLADRFPRQIILGWLLLLSGVGAFSIVPLTDHVGNLDLQSTLMIRILAVTTIIFFGPSCLLGMISPVVVKLTLDNLNRTGNVVGKIYAFSTLGSILGTFATGFFLISWMGTRLILFSVGVVLLLAGLVFGGFFGRMKLLALLLAPSAAVVWAFYAYGFKSPEDHMTYFFRESNYYTIKLKQSHSTTRGVRLEALVLDHLIHSYTDLANPLHLEYEYIRLYEELLRWRVKNKPAFRALFIGGGGYTLPNFLHAKYPGARMDVVEIDPEITRIADEYLGVPRDGRIRSFNQDARWFVMNSKHAGPYDFVFGDAFNDLTVPYHLTTKEFAVLLKRLLKPDGLFMANVIDNFSKGLFLPAYLRTLEEVFGKGNVNVVTVSSDYEDMRTGTYVVLASPQPLDTEGFLRAGTENGGRGWTARIMPQDILQGYLQMRPRLILTDDYVPVDNLIAPVFEERYGYRPGKAESE
ncbi:MAG: fused MFS/spermidine synthase [Thermodesulfobacteriota bacterium]